jgi:hypothetical protein
VHVNSASSQSSYVFNAVTFADNGDDGLHVAGAPGQENVRDAAQESVFVTRAEYGVRVENSVLSGNANYGLHIGRPTMSNHATVLANLNQLFENRVGIYLEQGASPGTDCGEIGNGEGCSGATFVTNTIRDNLQQGVIFNTAFLIPNWAVIPHTPRLGFSSNVIRHNAMAGPGCDVTQTHPQFEAIGPVGLEDSCAGPTNAVDCQQQDRHCVWTGSSCVIAWDIRGGLTSSACNGTVPNTITDYNASDMADNARSVGAFASGGAHVWADNNRWRTNDPFQNVRQAEGFIEAGVTCMAQTSCPAVP